MLVLHPYLLAATVVAAVVGISVLMGLGLFLAVRRLTSPHVSSTFRQMRLVSELAAIIGIWVSIGVPLLKCTTVGLVGALARADGAPMWESACVTAPQVLVATYVPLDSATMRVRADENTCR
jgi:hypothetical protein